MNFFKNIFQKPKYANPALNTLYRSEGAFDADVGKMADLLPKLSETYEEGGAYLLHKTLLSQFEEYDAQYGRSLSEEMNEEKSARMLRKVTSLMLVSFFRELSSIYPEGPYPGALTDALHYEMYGVLPAEDSFVDYLRYQNPNFEDARMAPAYKFGNDIAEILAIPDLSFSFMAAQQAAVISDISKRLMRWVFFDEPIESPPQTP
ncbi:MAG: hypothetical protein ACE5F7_04245 [Nitrospiria bacterium]